MLCTSWILKSHSGFPSAWKNSNQSNVQGVCVHTLPSLHLPTKHKQELVADPETAFSGLLQAASELGCSFCSPQECCVCGLALLPCCLSLAGSLSET